MLMHQSAPKESHLAAIKRIFRYLAGTVSLGLWYPRGSLLDPRGYSDADYAGCRIDRKSTSGTCQLLGNMLISWFSKKQTTIALSTAEAEYVSAASCCAQLLWMRQQLEDYDLHSFIMKSCLSSILSRDTTFYVTTFYVIMYKAVKLIFNM
ncbi:hypothetical protein MLD38_034824 [Melastoma candidum]|uniref:Uncharacterized protein n=1 Tax=Melastoma candidum TaxID=119954 RepID=A0ACB9MDK6_9MYRT|nr:hypothetical protein MLD38_034824 [Melastoma candidum]